MKYPTLLFFSILILTSCGGGKNPENVASAGVVASGRGIQADVMAGADEPELDVDYKKADDRLAEIARQLNQPNILKDDILRGWYLGAKADRKFGTPDTWIFVDDGKDSKWISPNLLEEEDNIDSHQLCRATAGTYVPSCLQTSDPDCEYVDQSFCQCLPGSAWMDGQGCILATERGSFVSINSAELEQGWYLGLPNEKKLNTPSDWSWVEEGRESKWSKHLTN